MRRILFLDSMRGFAIFLMMIIHAYSFATIDPLSGKAYGTNSALVLAPEIPLATMFPIFFFVSGISIAISISRRRSKGEGILGIASHFAGRALLLVSVGIAISGIGGLSGIQFYFLNGREPISLIGLSALLALPAIYLGTPKRLAALAVTSYAIVGGALLSEPLILFAGAAGPILLTGPFSMFKTMPLILAGASIGLQASSSTSIRKVTLASSGGALLAAVVAGSAFYTGEVAYASTYFISIPLVASIGLLGTPIFAALEGRGIRLMPLAVFGRTGLFVYGAQIFILTLAMIIFPYSPGNDVFVLMTLACLATLWPASYFIVRAKGGTKAYSPPAIT